MKQNYFKRVCSLLWLVLPMLIMPLEVAAQEIIPNEEVLESLTFVAPVEETDAIEAEVEALQEIVATEEIAEQAVRSYTYTVYRDGVKIASGLTEPTFLDEDVPAGEHTYCVEVQYQEGVSDKVCVDVEVKDFKRLPISPELLPMTKFLWTGTVWKRKLKSRQVIKQSATTSTRMEP